VYGEPLLAGQVHDRDVEAAMVSSGGGGSRVPETPPPQNLGTVGCRDSRLTLNTHRYGSRLRLRA
jgi:hypothetical protein